jgi:non-specific serine/threonine protein kinase
MLPPLIGTEGGDCVGPVDSKADGGGMVGYGLPPMQRSLGSFDRFQLEARLGRGGMGEVFAARDVALGRRVALKVIASELVGGEGAAEQFVRECRLASAVDHPHVVPIYEAGEWHGRLFLVMRFVEGVDLHMLAGAAGGLAPERAVAIVSQVALALDAIHAHGLVHRDVTPRNTLITEVAGADHAYLCDFGLATALAIPSRGSMCTGEFVGTFGYAAPEQLRGESPDARADVYGLGCVLFEAIAGHGPFYGLDDAAKVEAQLTAPLPSLAALGLDVPRDLDRAVGRAIDPDRERRFASAGALSAAATQALTADSWVRRGVRDAVLVSASQGSDRKGVPRVEDVTVAAAPVQLRGVRLFGRDRELMELAGLLADSETGLVTLTGTGGSGKTSLALEVSRRASEEFGGWVALIELASITDSAQVVAEFARVLEIRCSSAESPLEGLKRVLRAQRRLLVVDNFEHVLEAAAAVAELVRACPHLKILATSRTPLRVEYERTYEVPPLAYPPRGANVSADELAESPAVALFVERARSRDPGFSVSPSNADAVVALCAYLGGLPLALELAAAKAGVLDPAGILDQLRRSPASGPQAKRDAPERHRTIRAAIEWSYNLLSSEQQVLFADLGVFVGGFTLQAAAAVVRSGASAVDELSQLLDHGLVRRNDTGNGHRRFEMLEPIAQYAVGMLAESAALEDGLKRHARYFARFATDAEQGIESAEQLEWLRRCDAEQANLRAVLQRVIELDARELGLQLVCALRRYWLIRDLTPEIARWLIEQLAQPSCSSATLAKALFTLGDAALSTDDLETADGALAECATVCDELQDRRLKVRCEAERTLLAEKRGDLMEAAGRGRAARTAAQAIGDPWTTAFVLRLTASSSGDYANINRTSTEALRLLSSLGDVVDAGRMNCDLGYNAIVNGDYATARSCLEQAAAASIVDGVQARACVACNFGLLELLTGDAAHRARAHLTSALRGAASTGTPSLAREALNGLAAIAARDGKHAQAAALAAAAEAIYAGPRSPQDELIHERFLASLPDASLHGYDASTGRKLTRNQVEAMIQEITASEIDHSVNIRPGPDPVGMNIAVSAEDRR